MLKYLFSILSLKKNNEKINRGKNKRDKEEYYKNRRKAIEKRDEILEVIIYYYKIYK